MARKQPFPLGKTLNVALEDELRQSYLDYAISVIMGRALPDVRDGLKPVQRRILYVMNEMGLSPEKPYRKSARIVGDVLGKYHPHGDANVYKALVRMAQPFVMRYPLIDGQGNFGSIDGDEPAAMRYTEARLTPLAMEMLKDIEYDTVDFTSNFDATLEEPTVLPAAFPNLLVNGSSGIAVGMATEIPPHNLGEVIDGVIAYLENPRISVDELMKYIPAPDFPTGGYIVGVEGVREAYKTGRGRIILRGRAHIERGKRDLIVITEIPYQVKKADLIAKIAQKAGLERKKEHVTIKGIYDIRDESDREGMRIVIEVDRGYDPEIVLNQLYHHTDLETTYPVMLLAVEGTRPKVYTLKGLVGKYAQHRKEVVTRRIRHLLKKAEERAHILEGLKIALANLDEVIKIIKTSSNSAEARKRLVESFDLTPVQAQGILDMRLHQLTQLEVEKLEQEYEELLKKIAYYKSVLGSEKLLIQVIKEELLKIKEKFADVRRTQIITEEEAAPRTFEDLVHREDKLIVLTSFGFIKRMKPEIFKLQRRGGKGIIGMPLYPEDVIWRLAISSTHDQIAFFSSRGKVYWTKTYDISEQDRNGKGESLAGYFPLSKGERVDCFVSFSPENDKKFLLFVTEKGVIKKLKRSALGKPQKRGIFVIELDEGNSLVSVLSVDGEDVILLSSSGKAIRFSVSKIRSMGKAARGVRGMSLTEGERIVWASVVSKQLVFITKNGFGKRVRAKDFPLQGRGGKGVRAISLGKDDEAAVVVSVSSQDSHLMISTARGKIIRIPVQDIPIMGRSARGVKLVDPDGADWITAACEVSS